jgi:hypothetical protein
VTRLSQGDPRWANDLYDHSFFPFNFNIAEKGCALTSLSMALNAAGLPNDPGALNSFMILNSFMVVSDMADYKDREVNWGPATRDFSSAGGHRLNLKWHPTSINSITDLQSATAYLDNTICQLRHPVIVGVHLAADGTPGHFVVVTGKQGNDYTVADPGFPKTLLSEYNNQFVTRGFVADPPGDISELDLAIGDGAEILVVDASRQKTGYDSSTKKIVQQIPNSSYYRDALENDLTGAPPTETDHFANIFQPAQGKYQILVNGLKLGTFSLSSRIFSQDGSPQPPVTTMGIIGPGSSSAFSLQLNASPGAQSAIVAAATFTSTLADISNSFQLGLIDNQGIANSLSRKINAASVAAGGGDNTTAANVLRAFMNEVKRLAETGDDREHREAEHQQRQDEDREHTGKHITGIAPQVLLADAASLISQLR